MVLYLARMHSGLTLDEIGGLTGGMGYKTVYTRIQRFKVRLETDRELQMHSGLTLAKVGEMAGGIGYKTVSTQLRRFKNRLESDRDLQRVMEQCITRMKNGET
jgi:hypothetical protein